MILPAAMSSLMTSVNSFKPSPVAPLSAKVRSCARRASDSMLRSRPICRAMAAADCGVIPGSKAITLEAMVTVGMGGRIQTRVDPVTEPELFGGGKAEEAELETQLAMAGPEPTESGIAGNEPSARPAAGSGLWVETSAATGTLPIKRTATARAAGTCHRQPLNIQGTPPLSLSNGARNLTSAKRSAQATTRLPRIAVLVQNSSEVGPSSKTAS